MAHSCLTMLPANPMREKGIRFKLVMQRSGTSQFYQANGSNARGNVQGAS